MRLLLGLERSHWRKVVRLDTACGRASRQSGEASLRAELLAFAEAAGREMADALFDWAARRKPATAPGMAAAAPPRTRDSRHRLTNK